MRGEGNHKIPGSFAPENMEKTGADRVKYSLACQHEDAISIKFVSYAQKCPTVLCTFAVALRKESVDRNGLLLPMYRLKFGSLSARRAWIEMLASRLVDMSAAWSLSARRAWIEITYVTRLPRCQVVALRKESVDRNRRSVKCAIRRIKVALRKESVDRNAYAMSNQEIFWASLSARRAWIEISTQWRL